MNIELVRHTPADDMIWVYVGIWAEPRKSPANAPGIFPGTYGIVLLDGSEKTTMWGAGYARQDDALRAFAVDRLLAHYPPHKRLRIFVRGLARHVGPDGYIHKAKKRPGHTNSSGRPYDAYDELVQIADAVEQDRVVLEDIDKDCPPPEYLEAMALAEGPAKQSCQVCKPFFSSLHEAHERNYIVSTDEDNDPFGLKIEHLPAAE